MVGGFVVGIPSRRTTNFPESGRGLGHVTPTILAVRSAILATAWLLVFVAVATCEGLTVLCATYLYLFTALIRTSSDVHARLTRTAALYGEGEGSTMAYVKKNKKPSCR